MNITNKKLDPSDEINFLKSNLHLLKSRVGARCLQEASILAYSSRL